MEDNQHPESPWPKFSVRVKSWLRLSLRWVFSHVEQAGMHLHEAHVWHLNRAPVCIDGHSFILFHLYRWNTEAYSMWQLRTASGIHSPASHWVHKPVGQHIPMTMGYAQLDTFLIGIDISKPHVIGLAAIFH